MTDRSRIDGTPHPRRHGEGSVYYRTKAAAWIGSYMTVDGKRRSVQSRHLEEVERRLDAKVALSKRKRTSDRLFMHTRRQRAERWAVLVLERAASEGWAADYTAQVLIAQLSVRRVRADVFGPCDYCGSWIAGTIDHVVPQVDGGTNDPSNLVSACFSCNSSKNHRPLAQWAGRGHSAARSAVRVVAE